jgi:hypothetical protein
MKFNIKVILLGGLAMYAAQWIVSMMTGIFDNIRSALDGFSMIKGIKFGFILCLIYLGMSAEQLSASWLVNCRRNELTPKPSR